MVHILGKRHSLLDPAHHPKLLYVDALATSLQVTGLLLLLCHATSPSILSALPGDTIIPAKVGADFAVYILGAGLAIQLLSVSVFIVLFSAVLVRASLAARRSGSHVPCTEAGKEGGGRITLSLRFKAYIVVTSISLACLLARTLYAVISALGGGPSGEIAANEALFTGLDGLMVSQAVVGVVAVHPGRFLEDAMAAACPKPIVILESTRRAHELALRRHEVGNLTGGA